MINTFHSSFNTPPVPPPIPPRHGHRGSALAKNTPLVKFLSVMLLLLMILTFGGFVYLFYRLGLTQNGYTQLQQCDRSDLRPDEVEYCKKLMKNNKAGIGQEGRAAFLTGRLSFTPLAQLILKWESTKSDDHSDTLLWNTGHSLLKDISVNSHGIITIKYPGYYFIYSQVSFSKGHVKVPLGQALWTQKTKKDTTQKQGWEKMLMAFCSLPQNSGVPDLCTASLFGVFELEENQQLLVNVTGKDLVNAESSTFGLFRLQD
ncbi:CD40 ligand isoform X2 [Hoplias malabaricus]|uniref:CD40 ligand isoform X2 n=1 Tax=Hoplias malabaricus TaxID=27720 RepID=UPI003462F6A9